MRAYLMAFVVALCAVPANAQVKQQDNAAERYIFSAHRYGVEHGLPDRRSISLAMDERGFLWVATLQGLVRYDGYEFVNHTRSEGLSSDAVISVVRDADGMLWVGDQDGQVDILDPRTGHARSFSPDLERIEPTHARGGRTYFAGSDQGMVVVGVPGHLLVYRGARHPVTRVEVDLPCTPEPVQVTDQGVVWCWCRTGQQFDLVRITLPAHAHNAPEVERYPNVFGAPRRGHDHPGRLSVKDPGTYIVQNENGCVTRKWISTTGASKTFDPQGGPCRTVKDVWGSLSVPLSDDLWMLGTTIRRMRAGEDPFTAPILFDLASIHPEAGFLVNDILRDHMGTIWVATDFGLFKIRVQPERFQRFMYDSTLVQNYGYRIRGMAVIRDRLHVNTESEGYWVLNAHTGVVLRKEPDPMPRFAVIPSRDGGLWRSAGSAFVREDRNDQLSRSVHIKHSIALAWSAVEVDDRSLLLGTEGGLFRAAGTDTAEFVPHPDHPDLDKAWIWYMAPDKQGRILACTSRGLYELDKDGDVVQRWWSGADRNTDPGHYLPTDDIRHFHQDGSGKLWLATATRGALSWDPNTGDIRSMAQREGLPLTSIHAIAEDDTDILWMPTNNGLVRYDPFSGQVKVFTTADGITFNEFNRLAYARGPDGRMYFGGLNGITVVDPATFGKIEAPPAVPLVIKRLHVQERSGVAPTDRTVEALEGRPIVLHPSDRYFALDMTLLSFDDPAQIRYAWRLEGIDMEWNVQREPSLRFTSLPYGDQELRIKAMDGDGRWSTMELVVPLKVVRPLYLRWWFVVLCVLLIGSLVFGFIQYRVQQLREVIRVRDRIALDLHDEVGSKLSSIVLFSTAVGNSAEGLPAQAVSMLKRITDNSTVAMESMNDIVWSINSGNDHMEDLCDRMRAFAQPLCESAGIDVQFDLGEELMVRKLGMEERKSLYLIFKEAVNNAVKHARGTRIDVSLRMVDGVLELGVADNGEGFVQGSGQHENLGGNGLGNMHRRAREIDGALVIRSGSEGGTCVVLRTKPRSG